jgi:hypothetical protein
VSGEKRFRIAGPVYANQDFIDVEEMFAAATAGSVVTREGSVELEPGQAKSVVATFTDKDPLREQGQLERGDPFESNAEWVNTVVARYVEPSQKWNDHAAPVVRNTLDIIADGRPREASLALRLVRYVAQALRCAEVTRRLGREWGRATVTLGPRFCEIEDGDWVAWQSDRRFGGATRTFRVDAYSIDEKWQNTLTLREISASVYDEGAFDPDHSDVTPTTPPPDIGEPDGANWSLAAVTLSNGGVSVPALEVTGSTSDDDTAEQVIIEYWKYDGVTNPVTDPDDPAWIMEGAHPPTTTKVDITSIQGGQVYYVAVTYVVSGIYGDRLVLGPATAASVDVTGAVDGANSSPATASEAIAVGNFVNIFSSSGAKVRKANATDDTKPVNGYAAAAIANTAVGSIRAPGGKISGLTGLTPGATYYLDAAVAGESPSRRRRAQATSSRRSAWRSPRPSCSSTQDRGRPSHEKDPEAIPAALMLAAIGLGQPALAAADKPLVLESAKIKQLPASTTLQVNASARARRASTFRTAPPRQARPTAIAGRRRGDSIAGSTARPSGRMERAAGARRSRPKTKAPRLPALSRDDGSTNANREYGVVCKGSNSTVDITVNYMEVDMKIQ